MNMNIKIENSIELIRYLNGMYGHEEVANIIGGLREQVEYTVQNEGVRVFDTIPVLMGMEELNVALVGFYRDEKRDYIIIRWEK